MFIKISNLSDGDHELDFEEPVKEFDLHEPFYGSAVIKVKLSKLNNQVILNTNLDLHADLTCDRCGSNYAANLKTNYKTVYFFGKQQLGDKHDFNITYLPADTDKIYLNNDIRDYSILSVPMKKLCKADCKGLCFKCGQNLNLKKCNCPNNEIDSRWAPLLDIKNKINN